MNSEAWTQNLGLDTFIGANLVMLSGISVLGTIGFAALRIIDNNSFYALSETTGLYKGDKYDQADFIHHLTISGKYNQYLDKQIEELDGTLDSFIQYFEDKQEYQKVHIIDNLLISNINLKPSINQWLHENYGNVIEHLGIRGIGTYNNQNNNLEKCLNV